MPTFALCALCGPSSQYLCIDLITRPLPFGDLVALFQHFSLAEVLRHQIASGLAPTALRMRWGRQSTSRLSARSKLLMVRIATA